MVIDKDELLAFLKEHLSVEVRAERGINYRSYSDVTVEVKILLGGEVITEANDWFGAAEAERSEY